MRRVVTGWDANGNASVLFDGEPPNQLDFGFASAAEIWLTNSSPAATRVSEDPTLGEWKLEPPKGGTAFRVATYAPGAEVETHATETVDYIVVLSGELTLLLEDREVTLRAGDTLIQQATPHGWSNRAGEPCVVAAVLIDATHS